MHVCCSVKFFLVCLFETDEDIPYNKKLKQKTSGTQEIFRILSLFSAGMFTRLATYI
jgi:hypothetical protein